MGKKWLVAFNPLKTEEMIFSWKLYKTQHPPIHMNQQPVAQVSSHKHQGLTFSEDLSWQEHFEYTKSRVWVVLTSCASLRFSLIEGLSKKITSHSSDLFWNMRILSGTTASSTKQMNWKKIKMRLPELLLVRFN